MIRLRRTFLACVLVTCLVSVSTPRAAGEDPRFADIAWGTPGDQVVKLLSARGLKLEKQDSDGDYQFNGTLFDQRAVVFAMMSPTQGLVQVQIVLGTPDHKAFPTYRDVVDTISKKYGPPQNIETFTQPYFKGDGYEEQAVRLGKATIASLWNRKDPTSTALVIKVTEELSVGLYYESGNWPAELERRKKKAASIF
jgi:hypothetical protein